MKRTIVVLGGLVALLLVSALPATAQMRLGGKLGLSFGKVSVENTSTSGRTAIIFGGAAEMALSRSFALEADLLLDMKGGSTQNQQGGKNTFKLTYLTIPVLAKFVIPIEGADIRPQVYSGLYMSLKMNCSGEQSAGGNSTDQECKALGFDPSGIDFGFVLGGGIEVGAGPGAITGDLRYNLGLSNIQGLTGNSVKNRSFQILAGYMFPLGS